ncbi:hypothetical protein [Indiicoccus explosivorum]|uniref:hypothetical protein n=1 Tax=Indiicoccus explosivorum TaxID=1917864 RepID=UPI000B433282|nr:hypothetical protein [Indiicoccus explosivorum]
MTEQFVQETVRTMIRFNSSNIIQTFSKEDVPLVTVAGVPDKSALKVTTLPTGEVRVFNNPSEAAGWILTLLGQYQLIQ